MCFGFWYVGRAPKGNLAILIGIQDEKTIVNTRKKTYKTSKTR